MLSGKQEPSLQRPIEKAVKAYKLHTDNPVSPIKISATTVTRPLSFRSQVTYTPEKGSVRSVQSHRPCLSGRLSQDAPFQLVASNSLGLSRPVDFSCLEESPQRRTSHKPAQPLYDTSWMEYLSPAAYSSGLEDSSRRDYSSVQWQSAYSAPRRPVQSNYVPVGRVRDRRVRSLSEGFT